MQKQTKTIIAVVVALILLAGAFATVWFLTRPEPETGAKALHIDIVIDIVADGVTTPLDFRTDALYLRQALEEQITIEGEESAYGLMVKTVNGRTADEAQQEWWCFTKGGEEVFTGVDETPVADGDSFEITLTVGW